MCTAFCVSTIICIIDCLYSMLSLESQHVFDKTKHQWFMKGEMGALFTASLRVELQLFAMQQSNKWPHISVMIARRAPTERKQFSSQIQNKLSQQFDAHFWLILAEKWVFARGGTDTNRLFAQHPFGLGREWLISVNVVLGINNLLGLWYRPSDFPSPSFLLFRPLLTNILMSLRQRKLWDGMSFSERGPSSLHSDRGISSNFH